MSAVLESFFTVSSFLFWLKGIQRSKQLRSHSGTHSRLLQRLLAHGVGAGLAHHCHGYQPQGGREGQSITVYAHTHFRFCVGTFLVVICELLPSWGHGCCGYGRERKRGSSVKKEFLLLKICSYRIKTERVRTYENALFKKCPFSIKYWSPFDIKPKGSTRIYTFARRH